MRGGIALGLTLTLAATLVACDAGGVPGGAATPGPAIAGTPVPGKSPTTTPEPLREAQPSAIPRPDPPQPVAVPDATLPPGTPQPQQVAVPSPLPVPTPVTVMPSAAVDPVFAPARFHIVAPQDTSAAITSTALPHYALAPIVAPINKLFLFLPRTGAQPADYQLLLRVAAGQGYHVLGLAYRDEQAASALCGTDPDCYGLVRGVLLGDGPQEVLPLASVDGITNRLVAALAYLAAQFPTENWGQYLAGGAPAWTKVAVAGHSLGAGEAAYIASRFAVARVVMLSGTVDGANGKAASWIKATNPTPAQNYYALACNQDPVWLNGQIPTAWTANGLDAFGKPAFADNTSSFGTTHELLTASVGFTNADATAAPHDGTAMDSATQLSGGGLPVLEAAWKYLFGP